MGMAAADLEPRDVGAREIVVFWPRSHEVRNEYSLGWPLDQDGTVGEEKIAVSCFQIAPDEALRLATGSKHFREIDDGAHWDRAGHWTRWETTKVPQRCKVGLVRDVTGMRADDELGTKVFGLFQPVVVSQY